MKVTRTPFQQRYKRELNATWMTGKEDDITVVVGIVAVTH
jgi:hypothetical protein